MGQAASILIVDDDASSRRVMDATLSRLGYRTRTAEHGRAALAALQIEPADLVITDILMPEMDGIELIIALRGFDRIPKVIAISGGGLFCGKDSLRMATLLGADAEMPKPLSMSALARTVAEVLDAPSLEPARRVRRARAA